MLYDYIEVNDVKFEQNSAFDLIQPHPFMSLSDKNKTLNDIFEDSANEILHVREQI